MRNLRIYLIIMFVSTIIYGCAEANADFECSTSKDCRDGDVCVNSQCKTLGDNEDYVVIKPDKDDEDIDEDDKKSKSKKNEDDDDEEEDDGKSKAKEGDDGDNDDEESETKDKEDDDNQEIKKPGIDCYIDLDCDDGSGKSYQCEDHKCVLQEEDEPKEPEVEGPKCGDGKVDAALGEVCDGINLDQKTCKSVGSSYYAGVLMCSPDCKSFDTSKCEECDPFDSQAHGCEAGKMCRNHHCIAPFCGNGVKDDNEMCDGDDLGGKTCASMSSYSGGTLKCTTTCLYDTSGCVLSTGGNTCTSDTECPSGQRCLLGQCKTSISECDPMDSVNKPCPDNKVCVSGVCMEPTCGDKKKNQMSEECDGADLGGKKCSDYSGFKSGMLTCTESCRIDTSHCSTSW